MKQRGFTLIELLIVIAVLSILAVAVLSAINPVEQFRKARDAARKSDAAELLNAFERYYTTSGCWPWENLAGSCSGTATNMTTANPAFTPGTGNSYELIAREEVKSQFTTRRSITLNEMFVTEAATGQVSVCFSPESQSARRGGLGSVMNQTNVATATCGTSYTVNDLTCNVCLPQ